MSLKNASLRSVIQESCSDASLTIVVQKASVKGIPHKSHSRALLQVVAQRSQVLFKNVSLRRSYNSAAHEYNSRVSLRSVAFVLALKCSSRVSLSTWAEDSLKSGSLKRRSHASLTSVAEKPRAVDRRCAERN